MTDDFDEATPIRTLDRRARNFSRMPRELLLSPVSDKAVRLYGIMDAEYINRKDSGPTCWPSRTTLAGLTGMSLRSLDRALSELVEIGAIEIKKVKRGDWPHNVYVFIDDFGPVDKNGDHSPNLSDSDDTDGALSRVNEPDEKISRRTPSATDASEDDDLLQRFTELIRSEGAEMLALKAVDGDEWAIEALELARQLVNARALPMKDRPEAERFEDTPAYRLCTFLVDAMMEADPDRKRPNITRAWVQEAGRILNPKLDNRNPGEIRSIINWVYRSSDPNGNWWQTNIGSMLKFRKQFDTLRGKKAQSEAARTGGQQRRQAPVQQQPEMVPKPRLAGGQVNPAYTAWEEARDAAWAAEEEAARG